MLNNKDTFLLLGEIENHGKKHTNGKKVYLANFFARYIKFHLANVDICQMMIFDKYQLL